MAAGCWVPSIPSLGCLLAQVQMCDLTTNLGSQLYKAVGWAKMGKQGLGATSKLGCSSFPHGGPQ